MTMTLAEALGLTLRESKTITNVKFNVSELADIEQIKLLLQKHTQQIEIAKILNCTPVTVSRKIAKWMQTDDFTEWINTVWLEQYNTFSGDEETKVEAFKQLTRLLCVKATRKFEAKQDITETKRVLFVKMWKPLNNEQAESCAP